ncbi:MAG: hypothetical protein HQK76_20515 [Desulfobacterales bacterium]|nr:hypothetical protein [Desulfobacterales bacterium]
MKFNIISIFIVFGILLCSIASFANEYKVKDLSELGPGVHRTKTENGILKQCIIIGQSRISSALGKAKGLINAKRDARLSAEKEFIKWIKSNVKAVEKRSDNTILITEGSGDSSQESGKSIETSYEAIESAAEGIVSGLELVGYHQDNDNKILTIVLIWTNEMMR